MNRAMYTMSSKMIREIVETGKYDTAKYRYVRKTNFYTNTYEIYRIELNYVKVADESDWDKVGTIFYDEKRKEYHFV